MSDYHLDDIPDQPADWLHDMILQLERTEKATPEQHIAYQENLLLELLQHAIDTVPAYKSWLKPLQQRNGKISLDGWLDLPTLTRKQAVEFGEEIHSHNVPERFGKIRTSTTSGSTMEPFVFQTTQFNSTMNICISARFCRWHNIDYGKTLAVIDNFPPTGYKWPEGCHRDTWVNAALKPENPGCFYGLDMNTAIDKQCEWLRRIKPDYLHGFTNTIGALARAFEEEGDPIKLLDISTYAETLNTETRELIHRVFGIWPRDCYSSTDCGFLAIQSPSSKNLLVPTEVVVLEILDENNKPCAPGQMGRVIVTPLFHYAQPLIRWELGDYATFGTTDSSGLPFPVLSDIHGRSRNLFRFPGKKLLQPNFKTENIIHFLKAKQWQVAQIGPTHLEIRIVPGSDSALADYAGMDKYIRNLLEMDLTITYKNVTDLKNRNSGKFEDYICELEEA